MKKIISLLLALVLFASVAAPATTAYAAAAEATPIIYVRGNGTWLYDENGEQIPAELAAVELGTEEGGIDKDVIVETAVNIMKPFAEGLIFDKWDNYAKALYEELSPLMDKATLDGDGNPRYGTGIHPNEAGDNYNRSHTDYIRADGTYAHSSYMFHYDWRLDPYHSADLLHEYVTTIMETTGKSQVSFVSRCLGGIVLNAYIERYGHLGHIKNALYGDTLAMGCTTISSGFSGKIIFDGENTQRYAGQVDRCAEIGQGVGFAIPALADEIINRSLDLFNQVGATDLMFEPIESLYERCYAALIPALFHAFGFTSMPIYWAMVYEEDYDEALALMFGEEGSETYTYYEGLIEKILYYREHVTKKLPELYNTFSEEYGIHIGTVAKYGYLNPSIMEGSDELSDALATLEDATFGATTAKVGRTLSEEYIEQRKAEGKGKYISADKQVDTSTAVFPDTTWVIKNSHHGYSNVIFAICEEFCNGTNVTVETSSYPRFMMYDEATGYWTAMTEDNCGDLEFMTRAEVEPTLQTRLASLMRFLTTFFNFISKLFKGELDLSFGK